MPDQGLFDDKSPEVITSDPVDGVPATEPFNLLASIKNNEGNQKFKTEAELSNGYVHSQSHIERLETEMKELKAVNVAQEEKITTHDSVKQLLDDALENKDEPTQQVTPGKNGLTLQEVNDLMNSRDASKEAKGIAVTNREAVKSKLVEMYSDTAGDVFAKVAEKNKLTVQELTDMTETNPDVVLNLFSGADTPPANQPRTLPTSYSSVKDASNSTPPPPTGDKLITGYVKPGAVVQSIRDITAEVKAKYGMS